MQRERERFADSGGDVVVIGLGTPAHAARFKAETGIPFRLLVSPDKQAYKAMDLKRGTNVEVLGVRALASLPRAVRGGGRWRLPEQDWHQLGGAFVIAPGGELVWSHRAKHSGDNPPHEPLLSALEQAAAGSS